MSRREWLVRLFLVPSLLVLLLPVRGQDAVKSTDRQLVRVAIYDHSDGSAKAPVALQRFLTEVNGFRCKRVRPENIADNCLKEFDVLIVPGGSGSKQAEMLKPEGREAIRKFVQGGGGYVGICAGSYLATNDYSWSLGLLNAKVIDRKHWARGTGNVKITLTSSGKDALHFPSDDVDVYYGQGPLLAPGDKTEPKPYEALAVYASEIAKKGAPMGVMVGTTAIARSTFGNGRVICFSPHPEVKDGPNQLVLQGIRWVSAKGK